MVSAGSVQDMSTKAVPGLFWGARQRHRLQTLIVWCKCLIEFTFLQDRLRAKAKSRTDAGCGQIGRVIRSVIHNRCGQLSDSEEPHRGWRRAVGLSRTLMDARSAVQKRIVTMLRPHNTTLSNLE